MGLTRGIRETLRCSQVRRRWDGSRTVGRMLVLEHTQVRSETIIVSSLCEPPSPVLIENLQCAALVSKQTPFSANVHRRYVEFAHEHSQLMHTFLGNSCEYLGGCGPIARDMANAALRCLCPATASVRPL